MTANPTPPPDDKRMAARNAQKSPPRREPERAMLCVQANVSKGM